MTDPVQPSEKIQPALAGDDVDRHIATIIAMAARNGMEDFHAAGAFDDDQAPALNRAIRNRLYEALTALRRRTRRAGDPFAAYIAQLDSEHGSGRTYGLRFERTVRAAIVRAVREAATAEGIDPATADRLAAAGVDGAVADAVKPLIADGDAETPRAISYLIAMVPTYWEPAELSAEFEALAATR